MAMLSTEIKTLAQIMTIFTCDAKTMTIDMPTINELRILTIVAVIVALTGTKMLYSCPPDFHGINLEPPGPTALFFFFKKWESEMS